MFLFDLLVSEPQVEAVMDRIKDNISLDHMARLLVDVQQDSSGIVDSIISQHQRELLNLIFLGDAPNRNKVNLIMANEITPHLTAEEYMDKGEYENELKQVIGDTKVIGRIQAEREIGTHDENLERFNREDISPGIGSMWGSTEDKTPPFRHKRRPAKTLSLDPHRYFDPLWVPTQAGHTVTYDIIVTSDTDPTALDRIRYRICAMSNDIIVLEEILGYVLEALDVIEVPPEPPEQAGRSLYERLEISGMRSQLLRRSADLKKNVSGSQQYLDVLREMSAVRKRKGKPETDADKSGNHNQALENFDDFVRYQVSENKMFRLNESLEMNTKKLCNLNESSDKSAKSLQILLVMFAGMLAFDVLDRLTGDWTVTNSDWFQAFYVAVIQSTPILWFIISLLVWGLVALLVWRVFKKMHFRSQGLTTIRTRFYRKVFQDKLQAWLKFKAISLEERNFDLSNDLVRITYEERHAGDWGGFKPKVVVEYDERNNFLMAIEVTYNRREANKNFAYNYRELKDKIQQELDTAQGFQSLSEIPTATNSISQPTKDVDDA
ncbi:unnamed protein product [Ectocarpus sp. CCAP 1310/34]|nr:unnamed protein product [Ectocarpus sp. CCAP 1310/34]